MYLTPLQDRPRVSSARALAFHAIGTNVGLFDQVPIGQLAVFIGHYGHVELIQLGSNF